MILFQVFFCPTVRRLAQNRYASRHCCTTISQSRSSNLLNKRHSKQTIRRINHPTNHVMATLIRLPAVPGSPGTVTRRQDSAYVATVRSINRTFISCSVLAEINAIRRRIDFDTPETMPTKVSRSNDNTNSNRVQDIFAICAGALLRHNRHDSAETVNTN